ncbi:MAG TPA: protein kinase [Bacteroidota bacterium]|nr:protein kinase [Bacteroidota bacterium]
MIGSSISHYKILEKLGEGGMGVVYKAQDTKLDRIVALKFLPHHLTANDAEKARFLQEAKAAAAINHPNACSVIDIQEVDDQQFIIMEYVDGTTLRKKIPIQKVDDALTYAVQIGEALQEAHSKGIVHRDVKAENIMVNSKNQIKVMDFGLAKLKGSLKLTRTSSTVGTLAYMAPEQIQGGEVDARSDIFSFGIVLFEMLSGKTPFRGEHDASMMYSILNEEPESILKFAPGISPEIDRIIKRALEKDPADRYQSVADMVSELRREQKKSTRVIRPAVSGSAIPVQTPSPETQATSSSSGARGTGSVKKVLIGSGVLLLIAAAVFFYLKSGSSKAIDSLAVLPFEDAGATPDQEYLADGVTESIINNLSKISSLRVVPRSTVFRFKGKGTDIQEIGSKLNVNALLSGRITHRGQTVDVQVDLIDVKNESQLWGNKYESVSGDMLSLQEQITTDVSSRLGLAVSEETQQKLAKHTTENTQAYQLYLQGRYYWNKRNGAAIERGIDYFKQAIALDPTYALAYAGLADCYIIQSQYAGIPTSITIPLTDSMARKALALDNSLAEAHTTLAFTYFEQWKYEEAEREFKQAIAMNPRYPTAYHWYNILLLRTGRVDEAEPVIKKGYELDPFSPIITLNVGAIFLSRKQFDAALPYFKKCIELDPSFAPGYGWLGMTYEQLKNYSEAIPAIQKSVELSGRSAEYVGYLGYALGRMGKRDEALALLKENQDRYRAGTGAAYNVARIYAGLGEKENVLQWLEKDFEDHSTWINSLIEDWEWDLVRTDPRFIDMEKKMGLVK